MAFAGSIRETLAAAGLQARVTDGMEQTALVVNARNAALAGVLVELMTKATGEKPDPSAPRHTIGNDDVAEILIPARLALQK